MIINQLCVIYTLYENTYIFPIRPITSDILHDLQISFMSDLMGDNAFVSNVCV